ncbi:RICIN domain-containing protein [Streptomyces sp. NPDC046942]|uniref:RICIN domain-containing protein n=1 Tax=Streptomyces sp. NPDC046942 TaxID=3155137 RepID=UPI0033E9D2EC
MAGNGGNTYVATGPPHNDVLTGNVPVSGTNWPQGAQQVIQTPDIVQQAPDGTAGSLWLPVRQSDGSCSFQNRNSDLCLDVYGGGSDLGRQLDQRPCKNTGGNNQDFTPPSADRLACSFTPHPLSRTSEER